jgi:hypothetical protein
LLRITTIIVKTKSTTIIVVRKSAIDQYIECTDRGISGSGPARQFSIVPPDTLDSPSLKYEVHIIKKGRQSALFLYPFLPLLLSQLLSN